VNNLGEVVSNSPRLALRAPTVGSSHFPAPKGPKSIAGGEAPGWSANSLRPRSGRRGRLPKSCTVLRSARCLWKAFIVVVRLPLVYNSVSIQHAYSCAARAGPSFLRPRPSFYARGPGGATELDPHKPSQVGDGLSLPTVGARSANRGLLGGTPPWFGDGFVPIGWRQ